MAANTNPVFARTPDVQWNTISAANTAMDGTGTVVTVWTADATEGGYADRMRIRAAGTNVQTVLRVFINNGSTNATPGNNTLIDEIPLNATTASNTNNQPYYELRLGFPMMAGHKINVALGTAVAAGYAVTVFGGKY